jgi:hypothetical protein
VEVELGADLRREGGEGGCVGGGEGGASERSESSVSGPRPLKVWTGFGELGGRMNR